MYDFYENFIFLSKNLFFSNKVNKYLYPLSNSLKKNFTL